MTDREELRLLVADPVGVPNPDLVIAAGRAGALGILDLAADRMAADLDRVRARLGGQFAVRADRGVPLEPGELADDVTMVVLRAALDGTEHEDLLHARVHELRAPGRRIVVEVTSLEAARTAREVGADGLIAKGSESGGLIGDTESFILLQQVLPLGIAVWIAGGIGRHTAAGVIAAGAAGVVLDAAVALTRESSLPDATRSAVAAMDGSETRVVGRHRIFVRPDLPAATLPEDLDPTEVVARLGVDLQRDLVPLGQDAAVAARFAECFVTVGGVVRGVREAIAEHLAAAAAVRPLAPGAGVAASHALTYPVAQGPMTRVSDRAAFAAAVASNGGLPFIALALLRAPEVRELLDETAALLGSRPWGVGILGFVPPELRDEQLEVVRAVRPPVALIAGGRPSQAQPLEADGIATYLHVPSPGLLDRFIKDGARRFVFEGRECGGHVGPRASFPLWEAQIERLLEVDAADELDVLFAGGIHDAASAAAVAAAAAPLAARGAHLGVLMGTAYLFTEEAVVGGAIQPAFQDMAVDCTRTVLLETSPGHATRCVETEYVRAFADRKAELQADGVDVKTMWAELEQLNLGRLRIASKGFTREGDVMVELDAAEQRREGMYMIGQAATLRDRVTTIAQLHEEVSVGSTEHLCATAPRVQVHAASRTPQPLDVAIVGMAAMFPGAPDVHRFWAEILAGENAIIEVPARRFDASRVYDPAAVTEQAGRHTPSKWGGFLPAIDFDPLAYGIPPKSLAAIEPVQLLALEVAARALADAGYATREFDRSRAAVVFGAENGNDLSAAYGFRAQWEQVVGPLPPELDGWLPELSEDSFPGVLSNVIAGRIANRLDLGGANFTVDAACAASLAALDAACKELRGGNSDVVLCGGADLHNGLNDYLLFASVHALSPTGQCRTFDAAADGIALGEGVACLVLKRRVDAERDGDRIYAVIDAVAGSSDGRHLGLTAPRKEGQQRALRRAYEQAGRPAASIGLVEAHGTGTVVGDRTELATLTEVFEEQGAVPGGCVLGSVKSQIGHTKCAAGLAGLVKAARAVYHGVLPPTINVAEPNAYYDAERSPFRFLDGPRPWPAAERRAGVSAFGFGGANFHAVLSSHTGSDRPAHGTTEWPAELFVFRAETVAEARQRVEALSEQVAAIRKADPDGRRHPLRELAASVAATGRGPVQVAVVADDLSDLADKLVVAASGTHRNDGVFLADPAQSERPKVAFVHPGQGSQRPGMLADLFVAFPQLQEVLRPGERWLDPLYPPAAFTAADRAAQQAAITDTRVAQPVLGLAGMAVTRFLATVGVEPDLAGGHSYGELVALAAAGVLAHDDLLELSARRAEAILEAAAATGDDPGTMAAVDLPADDLRHRLDSHPDLVLANHNSPRQSVISGPTPAVEEVVAALAADGIAAKRIPVACAFHSPLVAGAADALREALRTVEVHPPRHPVWSNTTAAEYPHDVDEICTLIAGQVAAPVRFAEQVESMYAAGARVFVEAGPGRVLTQLVRRVLGDRPHVAIACDAPGDHGVRRMLLALGELAAAGVDLRTEPLFAGRVEGVDVRSWPQAAPGWCVDGGHVMTADGSPVAGGLQAADECPPVQLGGPGGPDDREATVREYLAGLRELVAAQRDVMLRYLGAAADSDALPFPPATIGVPASGLTRERTGGNGNGSNGNGHHETEPASASATAAAGAPLRGDALLAAVLDIVSERTGYPTDMLDPDLDLEADLSIDSIKRIEIIGELAERIGLSAGDADAVDAVDESVVEELAQLKTLRAVVAWIDDRADSAGDSVAPNPESPASSSRPVADPVAATGADAPTGTVPDRAIRYAVDLVPAPAVMPDGTVIAGGRVAVVGGPDELADLVAEGIGAHGATAERVDPASAANAIDDFDGLVFLGGLDGANACEAFAVLQRAALGRVARIVTLTPSGGSFGRGASGPVRAGGIRGLLRSLAREFPDRHLRAIDVDPEGSVAALATAIVEELVDTAPEPVVVGYRGADRLTTELHALDDHEPAPAPAVDSGAVVLVTGGARGITAKVAIALAEATGCRLELVGRSSFPEAEDPAWAGAADRSQLRRALLESGRYTKPAEIESACQRIEADREVRATLTRLGELGVAVRYHSLDVRDGDALGALVGALHDEHGRLDGIVHGAGVLDDRFVRDKTMEGFDRVFSTKVDAAHTLVDHLPPTIRFVAFFGSISGVVGNRGQVDYAAANDALDEIAWRLAATRPDVRTVSIDWGPWAGTGMVSPELEREYSRRGVGLVSPEEGVAAFLAELGREAGAPAQVVVLRARPEAFAPARPTPVAPAAQAVAAETARAVTDRAPDGPTNVAVLRGNVDA